MLNINKNNYEVYFIDYFEGNLSSEQISQLNIFLELNPDLKEEFDSFEEVALIEEDIQFAEKENLKKNTLSGNITNTNFDDLCIAKLEGDLNKKQEEEFYKLLENNQDKQKQYQLYTLTKLKADEKIVFSNKKQLKKKGKIIPLKSISIISAAASVAILVLIYFFAPKTNNEVLVQNIHVVKEEKTVKETKIEKTEVKNTEIEGVNKIDNLKPLKTELKQDLIKVENEIIRETKLTIEKRNKEEIAYLDPVDIQFQENKIYKNIDYNYTMYPVPLQNNQSESLSVRDYLALVVNEKLLNKKDKKEIELFDVAQAGVKGINKLAGTHMSLERVYDKEGKLDKTTFNSRFIAFSSPSKK